MQYPTIEAHNYANDRSSAEAIAVGQAFAAVHDGSCQNMRVIRELDALESLLAEQEAGMSVSAENVTEPDDEAVASAERDVYEAWTSYQRACGEA